MAIIYLRSTTGADANSGATWALAKATLAGALTAAAAGDTIWVSQAHAETGSTATNLISAGTISNPVKILCGNDAAEPPTALATGASFTNTGSVTVLFRGSFYMYGVMFAIGGILNWADTNNAVQVFESCPFRQSNIGSGGSFAPATSNSVCSVRFRNCSLKFNAANNGFYLGKSQEWRGLSVEAGSASPLIHLPIDRTNAQTLFEGCDFSNFSSTWNIFATDGLACATVTMRNCKLPASWTGALTNAAVQVPGQRFVMHNCASGATNYSLWVEDFAGTIKHETTVVKTGGASDGTTPISFKMTTNANAKYPFTALKTDETLVMWNETVGTPVTLTVDILHDSVTALNNDEVWLEVEYLGSSAAPLGSFANNSKSDVLATGAAQATSTATWTTTGLTNPNTQKLAVTVTPNMKGCLLARVHLAKPSKTIYIDPTLQVS